MIHTYAYQSGTSRSLMFACSGIMEIYQHERNGVVLGRNKFFAGLMLCILNMVLFGLAIYWLNIYSSLVNATEVQAAGIGLGLGLLGFLLGALIRRAIDYDAFFNGEVSLDLYAVFIRRAKEFPDLALAVDGKKTLLNRELLELIKHLTARIEHEFAVQRADKPAVMRTEFQKISLGDKSVL